MLGEVIVKAVAVGAPSSVLLALTYLAVTWIKHRPPPERRQSPQDAMVSALEQRIAHQDSEIQQLRQDVSDLRSAVGRFSRERHHFYIAINDSIREFPHTGEWWAQKLSEITAKVEHEG